MLERTDEELQRIRDTFYVLDGVLFRCRKSVSDDVVGKLDKDGYLVTAIRLNGKYINLKVHHICWYLYYGEWPTEQLDHKVGYFYSFEKALEALKNKYKELYGEDL